MAIPQRHEPPDLAGYLAVMSRAVFQAGLSWKAIDDRWDAYLRLFAGFDPVRVAAFDDDDVARIVADGGAIRTRKKIVATIENARTLLALDAAGGLPAYLASFATYEELERDLRARFKFVGALSAYYFVFLVGGRVPRFEEWERTIPGDHPRMRETIAHARANGYLD